MRRGAGWVHPDADRGGGLPGKGVVEDEQVDAWCADFELALDVLLVGIAAGGGNEHLGGEADGKVSQKWRGHHRASAQTLYLGEGN